MSSSDQAATVVPVLQPRFDTQLCQFLIRGAVSRCINVQPDTGTLTNCHHIRRAGWRA
jgi:hypothetical protein